MKGCYCVVVVGSDGVDVNLITKSKKKAEKRAEEKTDLESNYYGYCCYYKGASKEK